MTTIAYRDGIIAADSMVSSCGSQFGFTDKIALLKIDYGRVILAGACGNSALCRRFLDWFEKGMQGEAPSMKSPNDNTATAAIFHDRYNFTTYDADGKNELYAPFFAMGSGGPFAKGAMAAGVSAEEAVKIAADFDLYTGGKVSSLRGQFERGQFDKAA